MKDRHEEARLVTSRIQADRLESPEVSEALQLIIDTIAHEKATSKVSWGEVITDGEQQTLRRICLGAGTSLMQQMGGKFFLSLEIQEGSRHCEPKDRLVISLRVVLPK